MAFCPAVFPADFFGFSLLNLHGFYAGIKLIARRGLNFLQLVPAVRQEILQVDAAAVIGRVFSDDAVIPVLYQNADAIDPPAGVGVHLADADAGEPFVFIADGGWLVRFHVDGAGRGIDGIALRDGYLRDDDGLRLQRDKDDPILSGGIFPDESSVCTGDSEFDAAERFAGLFNGF